MNLFRRASTYIKGVDIIRDWLGNDGVVVEQSLSQFRANICLECPENQQGGKLAESVANAVKEHLELKNNLELRVVGEKSLKRCNVCLCELRLKVHVPLTIIKRHMTPTEFEKYPAHCWQVTEKL